MAIDLDDDIVQDFLVESREILDRLGEQLVDLEQHGEDKDLLNSVFRGFHTIKGGAGFLGLDPLVDVCHRTEDVFNLLRNGDKQVSQELMDSVLRALDVVVAQFGQIESGSDPEPAPAELLQELDRLKKPDAGGSAPPAAGAEPAPAAAQPATPGQGGDGSDAEFDELLTALDEGDEASVDTGGDEISDAEFEQLLDELHGKGQHQGKPAAEQPAADAPAGSDSGGGGEEITEEEFEQLLDSLYGPGAAPGKDAPPPAVDGAQESTPEPAPPQPSPSSPSAPEQPAAESPQPATGQGSGGAEKPARQPAAGGGGNKGGGGGGAADKGGAAGADAGGGGNKVEASVRVIPPSSTRS